ncbi:hypothetical protein Sste5346_004080 [Sporothrix stenoceras]|uniref:MARVEL domain-containing protein n=1 Tax=Sporothrix stenoceras TaxID=5173 RepID=A0ABR3ZAJ2_9PEZI
MYQYPQPAMYVEPPKKKSFSWSTVFYTTFGLLALATNIPIAVVAAKLLHRWPAFFHKAGVPLAAAIIAIVADAMAILFFAKRYRAFWLVVPLDLLVAIMAAVGVFSLLGAGFSSSNMPLTDAQAQMMADWSLDQDLGVIFSGLVCGVRVLSLFVNSILSCLIFTRTRRHEPTTVQAIQTTELY